jgi:hypothetical protein
LGLGVGRGVSRGGELWVVGGACWLICLFRRLEVEVLPLFSSEVAPKKVALVGLATRSAEVAVREECRPRMLVSRSLPIEARSEAESVSLVSGVRVEQSRLE